MTLDEARILVKRTRSHLIALHAGHTGPAVDHIHADLADIAAMVGADKGWTMEEMEALPLPQPDGGSGKPPPVSK